ELRNVVERLLLFATDARVEIECARGAAPELFSGGAVAATHSYSGALSSRVVAFERDTILAELKAQQYHVTNTAKALGLERSHLYKKCQQLNIDLNALRKTDE
ncbi:MAG: sigma-54-dependent Fis family transcriptional regulator, partial [Acidobacteriaceae bacterium]|nr:sigma-54-dependent Fis family transcriptional regulator [Acidobacteriaceae bacterium]